MDVLFVQLGALRLLSATFGLQLSKANVCGLQQKLSAAGPFFPNTRSFHFRSRVFRSIQLDRNRHVPQIFSVLSDQKKSEQPVDEKPALFLRWLEENGVQTSLDITSFDGVRGLAATKNVAVDEQLIVIPERLMMNLGRVRESPLVELVQDDHVSERVALALFLLYEAKKGEDSFWHPYISVLPKTVPDALHWSEADLELLKGSPSYAESVLYREKTAEVHQTLSRVLGRSLLKGVFEPSSVSLDEFLWAVSMVASRGITLPIPAKTVDATPAAAADSSTADAVAQEGDQLCLVPFADLLNHVTEGDENVKWEMWVDAPDGRPDELHVMARALIKAGQQAFATYGPLPNYKLISTFGFALPDNAKDAVDLDMAIDKWDRLRDHKAKWLERRKLGETAKFNIGKDLVVGEEMVYFLATMVAESVSEFCESGIMAAVQDGRVYRALIAACTARLAQYPDQPASDSDSDSALRAALRSVTESERWILTTLIDGLLSPEGTEIETY